MCVESDANNITRKRIQLVYPLNSVMCYIHVHCASMCVFYIHNYDDTMDLGVCTTRVCVFACVFICEWGSMKGSMSMQYNSNAIDLGHGWYFLVPYFQSKPNHDVEFTFSLYFGRGCIETVFMRKQLAACIVCIAYMQKYERVSATEESQNNWTVNGIALNHSISTNIIIS